MRRYLFLLAVIVFGVVSCGFAATSVSGYQWGTWDASGSPYILSGNVTVPKEEPYSDHNGNGTWDDAEPFSDYGSDGKPNTGDSGEGDGIYTYGEPYSDLDGSGHWDGAEPFTDINGNGVWTSSFPPLTISPGVKIYSKYGTYNTSCDIRVNGTLDADGAIFYNRTSSSTNFRLLIRENAVCNIDSCEVGELVIYYLDGSSGSVLSSSMGTFYIYDTAAFFKCNNFSLSTIILYGDPTSVLFLEDNYWGTTDPVIIETKITHHVDDPNRVVLQTELDISEN
jgi:hypothetical protein